MELIAIAIAILIVGWRVSSAIFAVADELHDFTMTFDQFFFKPIVF